MKLNDFLSVLTTQDVKVTVKQGDKEVIKFYSQGYEGVESDVLNIAVTSIEILAPKDVVVTIAGD